MSQYRIKRIITQTSDGQKEKYLIQKKVLWWWWTVRVPVILSTFNNSIDSISAFEGKKLSFDDSYTMNDVVTWFEVLQKSKETHISLAWYCDKIVYFDAKYLLWSEGYTKAIEDYNMRTSRKNTLKEIIKTWNKL